MLDHQLLADRTMDLLRDRINVSAYSLDVMVNPKPFPGDPIRFEHACWMLLQAATMEDAGKANRWIGFAQAVAMLTLPIKLKDLRALSKEG